MVWTKYKCRCVCLKRAVLYCLNVIYNKQAHILKKFYEARYICSSLSYISIYYIERYYFSSYLG